MKAVTIKEYGALDHINIEEVSTPTPAADEVQIAIHYGGINPVDWKVAEGHIRGLLPHQLPIVLGWDGAGIVSATGENVSHLSVGDRVYSFFRKPTIQWGSFCEHCVFTAEHVVKVPKKLSLAEAATIPLSALTAWQALKELANLQAGDTILIHAGAGGVGTFALQMAKYIGAKVYTTASSRNHDYVKQLGADIAIDYTQESFIERIRKEEPNGLDVVFDCVGGQTLKDSYQLVKDGGKLPSIVSKPDITLTEPRNIQSGFVFVRPDGDHLSEISRLIDEGKIFPPEIEIFPMKDVIKALTKSKQGHTRGKIAVKIIDN